MASSLGPIGGVQPGELLTPSEISRAKKRQSAQLNISGTLTPSSSAESLPGSKLKSSRMGKKEALSPRNKRSSLAITELSSPLFSKSSSSPGSKTVLKEHTKLLDLQSKLEVALQTKKITHLNKIFKEADTLINSGFLQINGPPQISLTDILLQMRDLIANDESSTAEDLEHCQALIFKLDERIKQIAYLDLNKATDTQRYPEKINKFYETLTADWFLEKQTPEQEFFVRTLLTMTNHPLSIDKQWGHLLSADDFLVSYPWLKEPEKVFNRILETLTLLEPFLEKEPGSLSIQARLQLEVIAEFTLKRIQGDSIIYQKLSSQEQEDIEKIIAFVSLHQPYLGKKLQDSLEKISKPVLQTQARIEEIHSIEKHSISAELENVRVLASDFTFLTTKAFDSLLPVSDLISPIKTDHYQNLLDLRNRIVDFVTYSILKGNPELSIDANLFNPIQTPVKGDENLDLKPVYQLIKFYARVAKYCFDQNDYFSAEAIYSGISTLPIEFIQKAKSQSYKKLNEFFAVDSTVDLPEDKINLPRLGFFDQKKEAVKVQLKIIKFEIQDTTEAPKIQVEQDNPSSTVSSEAPQEEGIKKEVVKEDEFEYNSFAFPMAAQLIKKFIKAKDYPKFEKGHTNIQDLLEQFQLLSAANLKKDPEFFEKLKEQLRLRYKGTELSRKYKPKLSSKPKEI